MISLYTDNNSTDYVVDVPVNVRAPQRWSAWRGMREFLSRHGWRSAWYFTKCALWSPHNVIRVTSLPAIWADRSELVLHASFQILVDFIERERPYQTTVDDDGTMERLLFLYHWWTVDRPSRPGAEDDFDVVEQAYEFEDNMMLDLLISLRGDLWT